MKRMDLPDLMKGLAVLLMVQVHIMELFARQEVFDSTPGKISLFLGGPFAAPLFLAVMGYFLAVSKRSAKSMIWRGVKLILLGLALNAGLNLHLLIKICYGIIQDDPWKYIFGADILFVAGISIIIISLLKKIFKEKIIFYIVLMMVIPIISSFIPEGKQYDNAMDYLLAFLWMKISWSYFPVIPWLSYALLGYVYYLLNKGTIPFITRIKEKRKMVIIMLAIILIATSVQPFQVIINLHEYYHHGIWTFLWISGFILLLMITLEMLDKEWGETRVFRYLKWTGKNVTVFYVVQWLIIGNLATWLYKSQYPVWLVIWFIGILAASSLLTYFYSLLRKKNS